MPSLEILSSSIVAVGSFNPPLISVDWLQHNGLVGASDAEGARARPDFLVSRQMTRFQTDLALVQVFEGQLSIQSVAPVSPALCDLATGIFDLLPHTPVNAVGLNFMAHFKAENFTLYHKVGDVLAPKAIWNTIFPNMNIGIQDLTMIVQEGMRDDQLEVKPNHRRVTVQPSLQIRAGIFLQINNHYGLGVTGRPLAAAGDASLVARKYWGPEFDQAQEVFQRLLSETIAQ